MTTEERGNVTAVNCEFVGEPISSNLVHHNFHLSVFEANMMQAEQLASSSLFVEALPRYNNARGTFRSMVRDVALGARPQHYLKLLIPPYQELKSLEQMFPELRRGV